MSSPGGVVPGGAAEAFASCLTSASYTFFINKREFSEPLPPLALPTKEPAQSLHHRLPARVFPQKPWPAGQRVPQAKSPGSAKLMV